YHVLIDRAKLEARGLSLQQTGDAIRNSNVILSPGLINENHQLELALVSGQATTADDLASIIVSTVNNVPVRVGDVATVRPGLEPRFTIVTADGRPAALVNILRQPAANIVTVADDVRTTLAGLERQLPPDVEIKPFYDQSILVRSAVNSVRDAIAIGLVLSMLILYGFLRNWGTTIVAALVIPITVLVTFVAMWIAGLSFDLMTLGGVAAAIGLVIDDAIVVVENIYTHLGRGESRRDAVQRAIAEISGPIVGSTITPVVVFLPLALLTGVTGVFFRSLALTMSVALLTSLVLALTFTPVVAEHFIRVPESDGEKGHGRILERLVNGYEWLLAKALRRTGVVMIVVAVIAVLSFAVYRFLGSEFLPAFDERAFVLDYVAPAGASLDETDRMLRHVEAMLKETAEVDSYSRRTGLQLGLAITEPNTGDFLVKLKDKGRSTEEVTSELRQKIESSEPALRV